MWHVMSRAKPKFDHGTVIGSDVELRAPIVCFLGHADTGKTSLLDNVRSVLIKKDGRQHSEPEEAEGTDHRRLIVRGSTM